MFSEEQILFMNSLGLKYDFNNLSDQELYKIEDVVSDKLQIEGFDKSYNVTNVGKMCESILDSLSGQK